jgi:hypothetical protein
MIPAPSAFPLYRGVGMGGEESFQMRQARRLELGGYRFHRRPPAKGP